MLDGQIARNGESVTLQRIVGTSPNQSTSAAEVGAIVRPYGPKELIGGITQGDLLVIVSPTDVKAARWPGGQAGQIVGDASVPKTTDKIVVQGRQRQIVASMPVYLASVLVRMNFQVRG